jgi:hypothetical protein
MRAAVCVSALTIDHTLQAAALLETGTRLQFVRCNKTVYRVSFDRMLGLATSVACGTAGHALPKVMIEMPMLARTNSNVRHTTAAL